MIELYSMIKGGDCRNLRLVVIGGEIFISIDSYNVEEYTKSMSKRVKNKGRPSGAEIEL